MTTPPSSDNELMPEEIWVFDVSGMGWHDTFQRGNPDSVKYVRADLCATKAAIERLERAWADYLHYVVCGMPMKQHKEMEDAIAAIKSTDGGKL